MHTQEEAIPVAKPWLGDAEAHAAARVIRSGWVTQGPEVAAFEQEFAALVGAPYACAVSSCTTALHLALQLLGVGTGDEVITVSHSFIASANSIRYCGAMPVFVDIDPTTLNMNPSLIERVVSPRSRAILCVHQLGMPCDLAGILAVARLHGLQVIEDAACALGSEILWDGAWERIGKPHGGFACFSFHPRKLLTTGDGGMVTTANPEWDQALRQLRQHGMSVSDRSRHESGRVVFEEYIALGYNYRMTDIQAAVGREQLKRLPTILTTRRRQVEAYREKLSALAGLGIPQGPPGVRTNWQSFAVRLPEGADQRRVMQELLEEGIATRRGVMCAHREPAYPAGTWTCGSSRAECRCPPGACARLSESERAQDGMIVLPLFHDITESQQEKVVTALARSCAGR